MRLVEKCKKAFTAIMAVVLCTGMIVPSTAMAAEVPTVADEYVVTLSQTDGGTLKFADTGGTSATFAEGSEVNIDIVPDEGYQFTKLSLLYTSDGEVAAEDNTSGVFSYSFVMPDEDITVKAEWGVSAEKYGSLADEDVSLTDEDDSLPRITINQGEGGTVSFASADVDTALCEAGTNVKFIIEFDDDNYSPVVDLNIETESGEEIEINWVDEDMDDEDADDHPSEFYFEMPDEDVTISPEFYGVSDEFLEVLEEDEESLASVPSTLASNSCVYKKGSVVYYDGWNTRYRTIDGNEAWCVEPAYNGPASGTYTKHYDLENYSYGIQQYDCWTELKNCAWISYGAPGFNTYKSYWPSTWYGGGTMTNDRYYVLSHILLSDIYSCDVRSSLANCSSGFISWVQNNVTGYDFNGNEVSNYKNTTRAKIRTSALYPDSFEIFVINTSSSYTQDILGWEYSPEPTNAEVYVMKESANEDVTDDDDNYSYAGAVYYAYTDSACTTRAKDADGNNIVFTTITSGKSNTVTLDSSDKDITLYVREITPSAGFDLDTKVYSVTIPQGSTSTYKITSTEPLSPTYGTLVKISSNTDFTDGNDNYSLDGAEFSITPNVGKSNIKYDSTEGKWYYYDEDGKRDLTYTGIAENSNGIWWVEKGIVTFNFSGTYKIGNGGYTISGSKVSPAANQNMSSVSAGTTLIDDKSYSGNLIIGDSRVIQMYAYNGYQYYDQSSFVGVWGGTYASDSIASETNVAYMKAIIEETLKMKGSCDVFLYATDSDATDDSNLLALAKTLQAVSATFDSEAVYPNIHIMNLMGDGYDEFNNQLTIDVLTLMIEIIGDNDGTLVGNNIDVWDTTSCYSSGSAGSFDNDTLMQLWMQVLVTSGNASAGFTGATITVDANGVIKKITYNDGTVDTSSRVLELEPGSYTVVETNTPEGYFPDTDDLTDNGTPNEHILVVTGNNTNNNPAYIVIANVPMYGFIDIQKESGNASITDGNSCYTLESAEYGIYKDSACTNLAGTLITDENGYAISEELALGTYYVKEISRPDGYYLEDDSAIYTVTIGKSQTPLTNIEHIDVSETPINDPMGITLYKINKETGEAWPQGDADLSGAQFTINFYDGYYSEDDIAGMEPTRAWVLQTVKIGDEYYASFTAGGSLISGEPYTTSNGLTTLPLGTYTIQETGSPTGYLIEGDFYDENDEGWSAEMNILRKNRLPAAISTSPSGTMS